MNSISLCQWRTTFAAVLFETDLGRLKSRITEASRAIDERLQSLGGARSIELVSLEAAQRSLAALERESLLLPRPRLKKAVTATRFNGSDHEVERTGHSVGSHVRFALPSGEVIAAEIVVIFTASSGKNILVTFGDRLMRISPEQILDDSGPKG